MRLKVVATACCACAAVTQVVAGSNQGLTVDVDRLVWPHWQARLLVAAQPVAPTPVWSTGDTVGLRARSASLFGDYYVAKPQFGQEGGLRVTSGVISGPRGSVFGPGQPMGPGSFAVNSATRVGLFPVWGDTTPDSTQTWPYLGVGYTDSNLRGGWGFTADLGLAAQNFGLQRVARSLGNQSLDDFVRDLRLTPVLQLGVSYRF
jgi:hypothetical protein